MMAVETTGGASGLDEQILEPLRAGLRGDVIRPGPETEKRHLRSLGSMNDKRPMPAKLLVILPTSRR